MAKSPTVQVQGHFGEWLQGRIGPQGPLALITLVCPALTATVTDKTGARDAAFDADQLEQFRAALRLPAGAWPSVVRDMPLGAGAGGSTATLVALARHAGFSGRPEVLAKACLSIEGATDPLMFPCCDQLLWASRRGQVLSALPPIPACDIVGGFWREPQRTTPGDEDFPDVSDLVSEWPIAAEQGDLVRLAGLASASAQRTTKLRGPLDPMDDLVRDTGALGHIRAHTGSARGLIFAPGSAGETEKAALTEAGLHSVLQFRTGSGS